jgi:hypothetical protein
LQFYCTQLNPSHPPRRASQILVYLGKRWPFKFILATADPYDDELFERVNEGCTKRPCVNLKRGVVGRVDKTSLSYDEDQ